MILISGFGGSGKTTCSNILHAKIAENALVDADHLFNVEPFIVDDRLGRIKLKNCTDVICNFFDEAFPVVICSGLVWSQAELDAIAKAVSSKDCEVWCFWLKVSKPVRHQRVLARARDGADSQEFLDKIDAMISNPTPMSLPGGHYVEIETDNLSAQEVVDEMLVRMHH